MSAKQNLLDAFEGEDTFGGPAFVDVVVDNGQRGIRGSSFFLSAGNPNNETSPPLLSYPDLFNPSSNPFTRIATPQKYDVCIDVSPISPSYLNLFYYEDGLEGTRWYDQIRLAPEGYPLNTTLTFSEVGAAILDFPSVPAPAVLTSIIASQATLPFFNLDTFVSQLELLIGKSLNIQYNLVNENPVASTVYPYGSKPVSLTYGFRANLIAGETLVTLESGNILDVFIGQEFFKISGNGSLGDSSVVTSILSPTQFLMSEPHSASGNFVFSYSEFSGTVSTSPGQAKTITLTSGNTRNMLVGQMLFKNFGTGELGSNAIITRILSPTSFTVSSNSVLSGSLTFGANLPNIDIVLGILSAEYNAGDWQPLIGEVPIHILAGITPFII